MDTTLVTVTVLSMGMAAALSVIVWRLLRSERERSEARVAALTEAAFPSSALRASEGTPSSSPVSAVRPAESKPAPAPRVAAARPVEVKPRVIRDAPAASDDLLLHPETVPATPGALFAEPVRSSPWGNRFAVMAGLALVLSSVVLFAMMAAGPRAAARGAAAAPETAHPAAGLELLSLRDSRAESSLTITGMVQNPRAGALLSRVAVTAYAFDDKGAFLASGRALIDVTSLAPGDESPFVVTVPVTGTVARYRIGFRGEDGRVIAHVDKRQQSPMAALW
jgi:hypothetical protein